MNYTHTIRSCFVGYIVQAMLNNFLPLLFLTLQSEYSLSLIQITSLVTINFGVQLTVDLLSVKFVDRLGYRPCMAAAHFCAALGFAALTFLPRLLPDAYMGIVIAVVTYAIGGGLLEVLVSPIVEACPTDNKEKMMSLLHSFYCWGQVGVVLLSSIFFFVFGIEHWKILALIWALLPLCNGLLFLKLPIASLLSEEETALPFKQLMHQRLFWIFLLLMTCAGACELSVSQWASAFAEQGLGVSKAIGDLMGPMLFAVLMGTARLFYGKYGERIDLERFIFQSSILCVAAYLITALSGIPVISLFGCGLCGFSVGILWPGIFSLAAASLKRGGTAMFALLALAGDVGCSMGPTVVGLVTDIFGGKLTAGLLTGTVFPLLLLAGMAFYRSAEKSAA